MRWYTLIIVILLMPMVWATENNLLVYKPNEKIPLGVHLSNITGDVTNANCSIQIRNSTYKIKINSIMNEIGNGNYNYTYNTSQIGTYMCRQNCTIGTSFSSGVCDFVVKGDNMSAIAVVLVMAISIVGFFALSFYVRIEAIKYLLISIAMILLISTVAIGLFLSQDGLPASVQNLMKNNYVVVLYTLDFVIAIAFIFILFYYLGKWIPNTIKFKRRP